MTVYLIATPTIDRKGRTPNLEPASKFGSIKAVLDTGDYPTFSPEACLRKMYSRLEYFDPNNDYLLWAGGETLAAVMAGTVLADYGVEHANWLRFDRDRDPVTGARDNSRGVYVPIRAPLWIPEEENEKDRT